MWIIQEFANWFRKKKITRNILYIATISFIIILYILYGYLITVFSLSLHAWISHLWMAMPSQGAKIWGLWWSSLCFILTMFKLTIYGFHVTSEARRRPYLCPSRERNYMQIIGQNYHFEIYSSVVEKIKLFWVEFSRWNLQYLFQSMPVS